MRKEEDSVYESCQALGNSVMRSEILNALFKNVTVNSEHSNKENKLGDVRADLLTDKVVCSIKQTQT